MIIFHHRDSRKCDRNNTMGKRATLNSEIVVTIIGLKKTGHGTKEMVELTGVCERSIKLPLPSPPSSQVRILIVLTNTSPNTSGLVSFILRADMRGLDSNSLFTAFLALGLVF